jgi:hypothetical protein
MLNDNVLIQVLRHDTLFEMYGKSSCSWTVIWVDFHDQGNVRILDLDTFLYLVADFKIILVK